MVKEIKNPIVNMREHLDVFEADYTKFRAGNKAAGSRARKSMLEIKKLAHEIRASISAEKAMVKP